MVYLIVFYIILSASELSKLGARIIRQGNNIIQCVCICDVPVWSSLLELMLYKINSFLIKIKMLSFFGGGEEQLSFLVLVGGRELAGRSVRGDAWCEHCLVPRKALCVGGMFLPEASCYPPVFPPSWFKKYVYAVVVFV